MKFKLKRRRKDVTTTVAGPTLRERVRSDSLPVGQTKANPAEVKMGVQSSPVSIVDGKVESQEISNEVTPAVSEIVTVGTGPVEETNRRQ